MGSPLPKGAVDSQEINFFFHIPKPLARNFRAVVFAALGTLMLGKEDCTMSDRRSTSSALNGAKSKGPVTTESKSRYSRNGEKHGMYSKTVVRRNESQAAFDELRRAYHADLSHADRLQAALADQMVAAVWRTRRIERFEAAAIENALQNAEFESAGRSLAALCGFLSAQSRAFNRALRKLRRCQEGRGLNSKIRATNLNLLWCSKMRTPLK
jgi:hypothetical protein